MNQTTPRRRRSGALSRSIAMLLTAGAIAGLLSVLTVNAGTTPANAAATTTAPSAATILKSFDPANIISDEVMDNSSTMSVASIQSFLNAEQPTCATGYTCLKSYTATTQTMTKNLMCDAYAGGGVETAATIIYKVAKACDINPQVILVVLQKEQSLITGVSLNYYPDAYRSATGLGCPDTAACDPAKYGFFNQVYGLGYWLVRYTTPPGTTGSGWTSYSWFPVGKVSAVLYNPSTSCGAKTLTIANKATASLYYYTPYTPNAASLAAGWGAAGSCGAYGNRNFYLYFVTWFGSTHYTVSGTIKTTWSALGGANGTLGNATGNAVANAANGGGTSQKFQHGTVYSSAAGTFAVTGAMLTRYTADGGPAGALGWPQTVAGSRTTKSNGSGSAQGFKSGWIYSSTKGTFAVDGSIFSSYGVNHGQDGVLGWPTSEIATTTGGFSQTFMGGRIYKQTGGTTHMVRGAVLTELLRRGGPTSTLGWPTGALVSATAKVAGKQKGTYQRFSGGAVYISKYGSIGVLGVLEANFLAHGGVTGTFGWPTKIAHVETVHGGGASQVFTNGTIYWSTVGSTHGIAKGAILTQYTKRGGPDGVLGWPTSGATHVSANGGGSFASFQSGQIDTSKAGTFAVRGTLLAAYLKKGGPSGTYGWPKGGASQLKNGSWTQLFTHGRITIGTAKS